MDWYKFWFRVGVVLILALAVVAGVAVDEQEFVKEVKHGKRN